MASISRGNRAGDLFSSASSHTVSLDSGSGAGRLLLVFVGISSSGSDGVTGVTYNGVAMSQLRKSAPAFGGYDYLYVYGLAAPSSGTHDVVVSLSSPYGAAVQAVVYSGAKQTGVPDSSNNESQSGTASYTHSTSVSASGCWLVSMTQEGNGNSSAGSGTQKISSWLASYGQQCWDSNGTVGTGTQSLVANNGGSANWQSIMVSIAPQPDAAASPAFLLNMV